MGILGQGRRKFDVELVVLQINFQFVQLHPFDVFLKFFRLRMLLEIEINPTNILLVGPQFQEKACVVQVVIVFE